MAPTPLRPPFLPAAYAAVTGTTAGCRRRCRDRCWLPLCRHRRRTAAIGGIDVLPTFHLQEGLHARPCLRCRPRGGRRPAATPSRLMRSASTTLHEG